MQTMGRDLTVRHLVRVLSSQGRVGDMHKLVGMIQVGPGAHSNHQQSDTFPNLHCRPWTYHLHSEHGFGEPGGAPFFKHGHALPFINIGGAKPKGTANMQANTTTGTTRKIFCHFLSCGSNLSLSERAVMCWAPWLGVLLHQNMPGAGTSRTRLLNIRLIIYICPPTKGFGGGRSRTNIQRV